MNIDFIETKTSTRHMMEKHFPRAMMNFRILKKTGFEREMAFLPELCDPDKISLDIGANIGMFTWHLRRHSLATMAFEPNPYLSDLLRRTFGDSVPVRQVALSNRCGTERLSFPNDEHALGSLGDTEDHQYLEENSDRFTSFDVETLRLDDLDFPPIGFIKIDVEGHELEVLEGAQRTIRTHHPKLLIEIEERHRPGAVKRVIELLTKWGYAGSVLIQGNLSAVSEFRLATHQNPLNLDDRGNRIGTYINNFIFTPRS
mgnify:FL=1